MTNGSSHKLLLDEMFSPAIAEALGGAGIDVRAAQTDDELRTKKDADIFLAAVRDGRILVTNNVGDFEKLRRNAIADGRACPSVIYTSDATFPRDRKFTGVIVRALIRASQDHEAASHGGVVWLHRIG